MKPDTPHSLDHLHINFPASLASLLRHAYGVKYFPTRVVQTKPLGLPEGDYSVSLGWRLRYPQGPFILRLTSTMNEFDVCAEIAKLFENQYGIKDPKHCYPNSAVLIRPERLDEEILMKDYDDKGNEKDGIVSTPFLEGIVINIVNKVVQVALGT